MDVLVIEFTPALTNVWIAGLKKWLIPFEVPTSVTKDFILLTSITVYDAWGSGKIVVVIPELLFEHVKAMPPNVIWSPVKNPWLSIVVTVAIPKGSQ